MYKRQILSGVPQGSVLGPLLFVIYINDIDEVVNSKLLKFADDRPTKIFNKVNSVQEVENLRTDLRSLVSWSKEWQMLLNLDKCKVMHLGYNNPHVDYFMDATQMQEVHEEKDLGVIVSDDLKRDKQCVTVVKKANKLLGMIKRNFIDRSKATIQTTFGILHDADSKLELGDVLSVQCTPRCRRFCRVRTHCQTEQDCRRS